MNKTRRNIIFTLATIPVVGVSACSSGGGNNSSDNTSGEMSGGNQPDPNIDCNALTPLTVESNVEACGGFIDPASARAENLGYEDASSRTGQSCAVCSFYQGASGAVGGRCTFFPGELARAGAWCNRYSPG